MLGCVSIAVQLEKVSPHLFAALAWCALLAACAPAARAHDSWFERLPSASPQTLLLLGTGNRFPSLETGIAAEYLARQGCAGTAGVSALTALRNAKAALLLRAAAGAQTCWVQLTPFEVELAPDKVTPYLEEVNASASLRGIWAAMQARGLRWQELYTKHARIELAPAAAVAPAAGALGMDARLQRHEGTLTFTVLRDGQPLPGLAVELRSATQALGSWYQTDDQGQLRVPALPAGRWLLRAIDLRLSSTNADSWESRFLTLAFDGGSATAAAAALQR